MRRIVPQAFFDRDPSVVAPDLLGTYLVYTFEGNRLVGKIVETEAYLPFGDEASHGFKRTKTRDSLYKRGGHAYVYALRHHFLFNIVCEDETRPGAVLIRSVIPIEGIEIMKKLRNKTDMRNLTNGPGKVCQAFGITRVQDGVDVTNRNSSLYIEERDMVIEKNHIMVTPRIGITKATDRMLRFYI